MKSIYALAFAFLFFMQKSFSQADCSNAVIICGNTQSFNPSGIGAELEELACGGIEHNSIWLAFQAKASGKLNFVIRAFTTAGLPTTADFDWSLFAMSGPPGTGTCDAKTQISCNFAGTATVFGIPGSTGMATPNYVSAAFNPGVDVVSGNWYMLLVDQFSNTTPLLFNVQFTGNPETPYINSSPGIFDNTPDFTITNTSGCGGTYSFTNTSSAVGGIASYSWDFGDGGISSVASPSHTFVTPGTYYVTLAVTDNNGCTSNIRKTIVYNNTAPVINAVGLLMTSACSDGNNGTLTVTTTGATTPGVTGGTAPYTFELVSPSPSIRPPQSSNTFTGLQPGGYTIKVTDACGKAATGTVTMTQVITNSTVVLSIQNIQSACAGTPSGTATLFASGTTPPYTMALVNSSPVLAAPITATLRDPVTASYYVTFTGLLPGVYTVDATDGCGKVRRATFTVTPSTAPTVGLVSSSSCATSATGLINVTATAATGLTTSGAPGTFQYALLSPSPITRPFQTSSIFENLLPGTYTVAVKDICGNVGTATTTVGVAGAPTFGTAFTTLSCPNGSTGTIEAQISAVGGGSPHTFELIAPSPVIRPSQINNSFDNLPPGAYTVRLTDACGTQVTGVVNVSAGTAPAFASTITPSCSGSSSGTITITPNATAISPFTFELISPGAAIRPVQGSNIANTPNSIFTALNQGSYTVRMTDGCGVPVTSTATVGAPTALAFPTGSTVIPSCGSSSTGRITVAVPTTGLGAYRYELIAPSALTAAPQYSRIFDNLPAGSYTVRITDSCGTQVTIGAALTITTATAPTLSVSNTASCATSSGTITCLATTANQGGGTYQYALIAPSPVTRPNQASPIFTALPVGNYTIQITDQCGLTGTTTSAIAAAGAFTPVAGGSVVACNGSGYFAQIIITNPQNFTTGGPIPPGSGGGPFTYAVYDGTNTVLLAGPQASNVFPTITPVAGTPSHTVRVTDICGNTSTTTLTINPPAAVGNATISTITSSCAASNTGVIRVTTQSAGGIAPYSYTLIDAVTTAVVAGPQTSIVFNDVPANATGYFVRSTDACGNTTTTTVPLLFAAAAVPTATVATTGSCASPATGRIIVTPGTSATLAGGTFTYALYDAANIVLIAGPQASPAFLNIAPATYTVRIIDKCGVTGTVTATVASGVAAPTASGTATGTCTGGNSGVVTAASAGGSLPITYTLVDQPSGTVITGPQSDNIFTGLAAGTYIVRVTDACGTVTNLTDIVLGNLITTPTISTTSAIDCSGSAIIAGYGGSGNGGPYTYAICSGAGCTGFGSYSGTSTFTILSNGTYRISARDRCGNQVNSGDIIVTIPVKAVMTGVTKTNQVGTTTITPSFTGVSNTPYYSVDGGNFSPTTGSYGPGCHTIRVANNNAGTFGCASDPFDFSVFDFAVLSTPAGSDVNCQTGAVTVRANAGTGSTGCAGSNAVLGIKLTACTGCTGAADPIGTIKNGSSTTFNLVGASAASFVPAIRVSGTEIGAGSSPLNLSFMGAPFNCTFSLPASLLRFAGQREGAVNKLNWTTASEQNNLGFEIQRSADGINYVPIGFVNSLAPGGNSNTNLDYTFTDNAPAARKQFYRLRQADIDGRSKLSNIVIIKDDIHPVTLMIDGLFPNPANTEVNIIVAAPVRDKVTLVMMDVTGKTVIEKLLNIEAGSNTIPVNIGKLTNGTYLVKLICKSDCNTAVSKFVKQ
ncbi:MAG: PKD domain-containing protein [Bacteroidota bacterium]